MRGEPGPVRIAGWRRWRRLTTSVAVIGVVLASGCTAAGSTAGGRIFEFNIYGNRGAERSVNVSMATELTQTLDARNPLPFAIALQEVCESLKDRILPDLTGRGYTVSWWMPVWVGTNPDGSNCGWYGNLIAVKAVAGDSVHRNYTNQIGEIRSYICLNAPDENIGQWVCSTHLRNGDVTTASSQLVEFMDDINQLDGVKSFGADLNLSTMPSSSEFAPGLAGQFCAGGYDEADSESCETLSQRPTLDSGRAKLDYVGLQKDRLQPLPPARISPSNNSDHHVYEGFAR